MRPLASFVGFSHPSVRVRGSQREAWERAHDDDIKVLLSDAVVQKLAAFLCCSDMADGSDSDKIPLHLGRFVVSGS